MSRDGWDIWDQMVRVAGMVGTAGWMDHCKGENAERLGRNSAGTSLQSV